MNAPFAPPYATPRLRRALAVVYRFYDAFLHPLEDSTPPVRSPLEVSLPAFRWEALRIEDDATYRFSVSTLAMPAPSGVGLEVRVTSTEGDYRSLEPILLTLPRAVSTPPVPTDFLIPRPLWPTTRWKAPAGETVVRGSLSSPTSAPVGGLVLEMWVGGSPTPPPGTPFTHTESDGGFLYRFPRLKGAAGAPLTVRARLNGGAIPLPASPLNLVFGRTHFVSLQRN